MNASMMLNRVNRIEKETNSFLLTLICAFGSAGLIMLSLAYSLVPF